MNDMAEPEQPLNINTLHKVYVVEDHLQLTIESNAEIIANCNDDLIYNFSLEYSQAAASVLNSVHVRNQLRGNRR